MPKPIPNAKEKIFETAKKHLFEKGYAGFTLRQVAAQTGMAVGTIYNYYASKDMLVASIMAEDWFVSLKDMEKACAAASSINDGVKAIYDAIKEYAKKYEPIWKGYKGIPNGFSQRHVLLRNQLSDLLIGLLEFLGCKGDADLCPLLAETILASAMQTDIPYSSLSHMIDRLFP